MRNAAQSLKKTLKRQRTHPCKGMIDFVFNSIGLNEKNHRYFEKVLALLLKNHMQYVDKGDLDFVIKGDRSIHVDEFGDSFYTDECIKLTNNRFFAFYLI